MGRCDYIVEAIQSNIIESLLLSKNENIKDRNVNILSGVLSIFCVKTKDRLLIG